MGLSLKEQISIFIRSLPNVEQKHDPMSEEAYFYALRNFAHFHGSRHIDIRLSKPQQEEALRTHARLFGVLAIEIISISQEAEARGCRSCIAVNASQGRCFHP